MINIAQLSNLTRILKNVLLEDENNIIGGYQIRSLYFDSYAETDFHEKMAGIENRKKIRLRIYGYGDTKVKLEIKRKFGGEHVKKTAYIARADAERLIDCDYEALRKYDNKTIRMIYEIMRVNHVRPVALVEYRRMAFIHPTNNVRVTLDSDIRSNETYFGLFDENPALAPVEEFAFALVEVKYDTFIMRWIVELLAQYDLVHGSYSKYSSSRRLLENYLA
jgi:hypothetical protein